MSEPSKSSKSSEPEKFEQVGFSQMFPLPLTPFETYMAMDQKPDYPISNAARWYFKGHVHRPALEQAFRETIAREPVFFVRMRKEATARYFWDVDMDHPPVLTFETTDEDLLARTSGKVTYRMFEPDREPCFTVNVVEGRDSVLIELNNHHSTCDGMGILQFFGSWLTAYEKILNPDSPFELFVPDASMYPDRANRHEPPKKVGLVKFVRVMIAEVIKWFRQHPFLLKSLPDTTPTPLAADEPTAQQIVYPSYYWYVLPKELTARYHKAGKQHNASMNSLFIRDLFLTIRQYSSRFPEKEVSKKWFRVLMPRNLRNEHHRFLPATNLVGYTFFDYKPSGCDRSQQFLDWITNKSHNNSDVARFLKAVGFFARRLPNVMEKLCGRKLCHCTAVISNLGNVTKAFPMDHFRNAGQVKVTDLELVRIVGSPLCRCNTPICLGVHTLGDETVISFTVDDMHFNSESKDYFIQTFFKNMEESAASAE